MDAIKFLQKMIQIDSCNPPGNEHRVTEFFAERCEEKGIPYKISQVGPNRSNFEITLKGKGKGKVMLCGHMDTVLPGDVPWIHPPFSGVLEGDKLYGRGASDMKSGLAAMFLAMEQIHQENLSFEKDLVFLATAGEEVDSCGARQYLEEEDMTDIEALIIGEPTNEKVVIGHKGALWLEITLYGKTSHGAMPHRGINAVEWMRPVMEIVENLKTKWKIANDPLGESTIAATMLHGGKQTNVIPDLATMRVDIRSVPPQSHEGLISEMEEKLTEIFSAETAPKFTVEKILDRPPILTESSSVLIQSALELSGEDSVHGVSYYTDGAVLNSDSKVPTLIYGPGDEKLAHQPNEYVDIHAYMRSIHFYKKLALKLVNLSSEVKESR